MAGVAPFLREIVQLWTGTKTVPWKATADGEALVSVKSSDVTDGILQTFDQEIYNVNGAVTTDGSVIAIPVPAKHWAFQVQGIGATGATLAIQVSLDGTNFDYLGLKEIGVSGNPLATVAADGVYVVSHTAGSANVWYGIIPFKFIKVDRIAAGTATGDLVVRAFGVL